jgi:hypothetical protein
MISKATMKNITMQANADTLVAFSPIILHRMLLSPIHAIAVMDIM